MPDERNDPQEPRNALVSGRVSKAVKADYRLVSSFDLVSESELVCNYTEAQVVARAAEIRAGNATTRAAAEMSAAS